MPDPTILLRCGVVSLLGLTLVALSPRIALGQQPARTITTPGDDNTAPTRTVVAPKILYLFEAEYPVEAVPAGTAADVELKVLVNSDGGVGDVQVVTSAGPAFDTAAVDALKRSVFTPAMVDGVTRSVYIPFTYLFEPPGEPVVPPPPTPGGPGDEPTATTGVLEGKALVAGVDAPLAGANVRATDALGRVYEVTADAEGVWALEGLSPGAYKITVAADGFEPFALTEQVVVGEATSVLYRLAPATDADEIIVVAERPPREVTRRTLERREISKVPGTGGDALRAIQSLPGVARPPGLAGALIVRGSSPQDTLGFVDGTLVPLIYHFGGLSSVIPTELLDKIDFYPGNFGSKYGRASAGVVDVKLRSPDTECTGDYGVPTDKKGCYHGMAQLDLIDARFLVRGPIGKKVRFAIAGRRSWVDAWLKPVLESAGAGVSAAPVYSDYQLIVEAEPSKRSKIRAQLYGTDDEFRILISDPSAQEPAFSGTLQFGTAFYRGQVVYENQLTRDLQLTSTASFGQDRISFSIGALLFKLDSNPFVHRSEFGWQLAKGVKANVGLDFLASVYDVRVRLPLPPEDNTPQITSAAPVLESDTQGAFFQPGAYIDLELQPTDRLLLVPAFRTDYNNQNEQTDWSPRITGRYTVRGVDADADADGFKPLKTVIKGGAGLYYQPPQPQELDLVFGTPGVKSNRAAHYSVGVEQGLTDHVDLSVEGYWKELDRLVVGGGGYTNSGTGRVIGAETLVRYKSDGRFFGWVAYTLSRSTRRDGPGEPEYLFQYDQTHNLTAIGSYRLGGGWEVGARFRLISGSNYTPVNTTSQTPSFFVADAGSFVPVQGGLFSQRLPLFNQLDIRIEKTWQFRDFRLLGYLDLWNAYNNPAVEGVSYNFNYAKSTVQTGLPIIPSLGFRGEF